MQFDEILIGLAEISAALAGFTGVVVAFGSRGQGTWHPGDRLRLHFLLEASLTAGGFSLLALFLLSWLPDPSYAWAVASALWALFMPYSLFSSHQRINRNLEVHGDVDRIANRLVMMLFLGFIGLQVLNVIYWQHFAPLLGALVTNVAGAAMQFARLIRSAFHN
jgi:hypothetical protein